jgi:CRISPR-associated protein Cmr1
MTRRPPIDPPPAVEKRTDDFITQVRRYKLITPLFGGGVDPQTADPVTVIRATEVRGHLRFWWRATRGGQFNGDLTKMRTTEELIWGSAAAEGRPGPSNVSVEVVVTNQGSERPIKAKSIESYIRIADDNYQTIREGVEFDLILRYPVQPAKSLGTLSIEQEIDAALWAWQTFGGIGARTRRGAGALQCTAIDEKTLRPYQPTEVWSQLTKEIKTHVADGQWPDNVPHLMRTDAQYVVLSKNNWTPIEAWYALIAELKGFRQWRDGKKGFGRTLWPEPEAIRKITGSKATKPAPRIVDVDKFPRAAFGLPIVFEMRHDVGQPKYKLQPQDYDRLASPLLLRPIACDGGKAIGLATVLHSFKLFPNIEVEGYGQVDIELTGSDVMKIKPLDGERNILQAFLDYLQS